MDHADQEMKEASLLAHDELSPDRRGGRNKNSPDASFPRTGAEQHGGLDLSAPPSGSAASSVELPHPPEDEKACFLCLESDQPDDPLIACCSRCHARTHQSCWAEWRYNQRIASLRARLLGERGSGNSQLLCTICKTGQARIAAESVEELRGWMLAGSGRSFSRVDDDLMDEESNDLVEMIGRRVVLVK